MKNILFSIITTIFSIFILILVVEISLRVFAPQQESMQWLTHHNKYDFVNKTNFEQEYNYVGTNQKMYVKTNSYGHRFSEYNKEDINSNIKKKIFISGDSFAFGYGVNIQSHFAFLIDSLLNEEDENFTIINSGVGGWGTVQEKLYAINNLEVFNPDVIVLLFFQNDPYDDFRFLNKLNNYKDGKFNLPGKRFFKHNSHLYRFLFYKFNHKIDQFRIRKTDKSNSNSSQDIVGHQVITQDQWNSTFNHIGDFYDSFMNFNSDGIFIVLTATPWENDQTEQFKNFVESINIQFLNLYDSTVNIQPELRRLDYDYHWSPLVHKIVAEHLADLIIELH